MGYEQKQNYKKIGLLGGMGAMSTADYYLGIIELHRKNFADLNYPEIAIESVNFQNQISRGYRDYSSFYKAVRCLELSGCDFFLPACNSIHVLKRFWADDSIYWLDIIRPVAEEVRKKSVSKVLIIGTSFTIKSKIYDAAIRRAGAVLIYPTPKEMEKIDEYIYSDLVNKKPSAQCVEFFNKISLRYCLKHEVTGVVLACTELRYIDFGEVLDATSVNFFDSTEIHIHSAYQFSLQPSHERGI